MAGLWQCQWDDQFHFGGVGGVAVRRGCVVVVVENPELANQTMRGGRGAFILLEGIDRSGKSTQARMLADALKSQGHRCEIINFPSLDVVAVCRSTRLTFACDLDRTTTIGKVIDEYLSENTEINDQVG